MSDFDPITGQMDSMSREEYKDEAEALWVSCQRLSCSCHISPPCSVCVAGFSLPCEEYVDLLMEEYDEYSTFDDAGDRYDRAMKGLK